MERNWYCECGKKIKSNKKASVETITSYSLGKYGRSMCADCTATLSELAKVILENRAEIIKLTNRYATGNYKEYIEKQFEIMTNKNTTVKQVKDFIRCQMELIKNLKNKNLEG